MTQIDIMIKNGATKSNEDGATLEQLEEYRKVMVQQANHIAQLNTEIIELRGILSEYRGVKEAVERMQGVIDHVKSLFSFYMQFINEQANDKIKLVRSGQDNTIESKLEAMEWMARYITYVSPNMVQQITDEFKTVFMTNGPSPIRQALCSL